MCIECTRFNRDVWDRAYELFMRNTVDQDFINVFYVEKGWMKYRNKSVYRIYADLMREYRCSKLVP